VKNIPVHFVYATGIARPLFAQARLKGSWDATGSYSLNWASVEMSPTQGPDGCLAFIATAALSDTEVGRTFDWGVEVCRTPGGPWEWAIVSEVNRLDSNRRQRDWEFSAGVLLPQSLPPTWRAKELPKLHKSETGHSILSLGAQCEAG
jgi:hypothetical protein